MIISARSRIAITVISRERRNDWTTSSSAWGLKSLAYPIQKKTTGLYWVLEYAAESDFNEKLKIQLLRDEAVLRHLCTKLDKYAVEYNARKKSGVKSHTEKAVEA